MKGPSIGNGARGCRLDKAVKVTLYGVGTIAGEDVNAEFARTPTSREASP